MGSFLNDKDYCNFNKLKIKIWNAEGFSDLKKWEVNKYIRTNYIDIMYLQEIRRKNSEYYASDSGYLIIFSGGFGHGREWNGIGFVISLKLRSRIHLFFVIVVLCAYTPHNLKSINNKLKFYEDLSNLVRKTFVNGLKLVFGDFNARLGQCFAGEEDMLDEYCFGRKA